MALRFPARVAASVLSAACVVSPVSAGDFILGTLPYERDDLGRIELPQKVGWSVMPSYRGATDAGVFTDERITLVLDHREERFWPLGARLSDEEATTLAATLARTIREKALNGPNAEHEARGMSTSLYTQAYTLNRHKAIEVGGNGVGFRVTPSYSGIDEDGERIVDERITLVLVDRPKGFWPVIAWMDLASARTLHADLERVLAARAEDDDC